MRAWWPARRRLGLLALLVAGLVAVSAMVPAGPGWRDDLALAYVVLTGMALFYPAAIAVQVLAGQALVGSFLLGPGAGGVEPLVLALGVGAMVAAAELLAVVARLDSPVERRPRRVLQGVATAALVGAGAFIAVLGAAAGLPGPTGLAAVVLASAACVVLVGLLLGLRRAPDQSNSA